MKYLPLIFGLLIVASLLVGCTKQSNTQTNTDTHTNTQSNTQANSNAQSNTPVPDDDTPVIIELNNTVINDSDLGVGTLY